MKLLSPTHCSLPAVWPGSNRPPTGTGLRPGRLGTPELILLDKIQWMLKLLEDTQVIYISLTDTVTKGNVVLSSGET